MAALVPGHRLLNFVTQEKKQAKMKKMMLENSGKTKEDVQATVNTALSDVNNTDLNQTTEEVDAPEGFTQPNSSKS